MKFEKILIQLPNRALSAFLSDSRIIRESVPEGYYAYGCRHSDNGQIWIAEITDYVLVNHSCDILTTQPVTEIVNGSDIYFDRDDAIKYLNEYIEIEEVETK